MVFNPVQSYSRVRISDVVAEQVKQLISEGALLPGQKLPSERELVEQLGVSRPSVREALRQLEADGYIIALARGGFAVADVSEPLVSAPLTGLIEHSAQASADVLELRQDLETMATVYAAQRATAEDLARIAAAYRELEAALESGQTARLAASDAAFHLAIADACHNLALNHVMHGLHGLIRESLKMSHRMAEAIPPIERKLHAQHTAIYEAIMARDPEGARAASNAHLIYVQQLYREDALRRGQSIRPVPLP